MLGCKEMMLVMEIKVGLACIASCSILRSVLDFKLPTTSSPSIHVKSTIALHCIATLAHHRVEAMVT